MKEVHKPQYGSQHETAKNTRSTVRELVELAERFHGHVCPFLVIGVRAGVIAMERLGVRRPGVYETVAEDLIAVIEVNNCFADGVQIATGCTLGNNSLVYIDTGKNALSLFRRGQRKGIRVYVDSERISKYIPQEAQDLFKKVVVERRGTKEEAERLHYLWRDAGLKMMEIPEEEFSIREVELVEEIERAPIFQSVRCVKCGELTMAPRAVYVEDKPFCPVCGGKALNAVIGRGISIGIRYPIAFSRQ